MSDDRTVAFSGEDAEMDTAIREAKRTFGRFLDAFLSPAEEQRAFLVKVAFCDEERVEHIWIADLDFSAQKPRGVIANEPQIPGLRYMEPVEFDPSQITDWMYINHGNLVGGYTTRVIRGRMSPDERAAFDAAAPYHF